MPDEATPSPRLPCPCRPEEEVITLRLQSLSGVLDWHAVQTKAEPWVQAVRDQPAPFWAMESLLKEYPISSSEGLALMRLAEALLRVPDADTAIALTADQLGRADFSGSGDSTLAHLSNAAIALSKRFLPGADEHPGLIARLGAKAVVAATLRAVQLLGKQFVLGESIDAALVESARVHQLQGNVRFSFDMLGEGARTQADADRYFMSYTQALTRITRRVGEHGDATQHDGLSIKLSALHPRYEVAQHERVLAELVPTVLALCEQAAQAHVNLTIDAEETDRLELSLDVFEAVLSLIAPKHPQWQGFGLALQAYQSRSLDLVEHVIALARKHQVRLMCRLVKGAYWDAEIKRAQELGLPHYPVFTHKHHTDISYLACARAMLAAPDALFPQFATHNAGTIAAILQMADKAGSRFELQRLHGMGEGLYREVLKNPAVSCRIYAPVGQHRDLLAYLVRRLLENGANTSFVHQLADESLGMQELLISPLQLGQTPTVPMPAELFGPSRANSEGLDVTAPRDLAKLQSALATCEVPAVPEFDLSDINAAVARATNASRAWNDAGVAHRAAVLLRVADAMQAHLPQHCALLVKEAHKTWGDAIAEVREAIDFLRYYAHEAQSLMAPLSLPVGGPGVTGERNELRLHGRGAWVCISPWNFPLAIFAGQVAAALVTGNTVLAKPAEQTPGVALALVRLMHQCGVPADALQLLHGPGETVGAALVAHPGIAGVAFTGSTQVAKLINRALADKDGPIVPLIAETGGLNAMVVDSSALPEQVADAVVQSAFRSAGQRCSALRLLCVHEAVADPVIDMILGAAKELRCGPAHALSTDVGPLIDQEAASTIHQHLARLSRTGKALLPLPLDTGPLIPPQAFELTRVADLKHEVFGPVLHIVRWQGDPLALVDEINALGCGLTLGIQTRIDSRAQAMAARARVGNVYINRNMVGAVVGLQPFGGEGLSGTGPKAGGPHYLLRYCSEQTVTVNTAAAGGNVDLLSQPSAHSH
jgi:RHH-type transcriptional regulator, proline utilization regulon repressor / proline dehydrogenase / delta 1-pyrroline-5-carboxylate dehydrogenase